MKIVNYLLFTLINCGIFEQFFSQNQEESHEEPQQAEPVIPQCEAFICPLDGKCVENPVDCECPANHIKCPVGEWYLCLASHQTCDSFQ